MPKFQVTMLQDAYIPHTTEIEAATAEEAQRQAYDLWRFGDQRVWNSDEAIGYDHVDIGEAEELDADGNPTGNRWDGDGNPIE